MNRFLTNALRYQSAGLSVIPIKPRSKLPLVNWEEYKTRRATAKEIEQWWEKWPDANVAIVTGRVSGVVVIDVDTHKGGKTDGLPDTGTIVQTGSGGYHYFYTYPSGAKHIANKVNALPGVDVRADGGYVVTAPSVHESGGQYRIIKSEGSLRLPPPFALTAEGQTDRSSNEGWITSLLQNGAKEGERNDSIARLAGYCAGKKMAPDIALAMARQVNSKTRPPLDDEELRRTVDSAYATARRKDRGQENIRQVTPFELVDFSSYAREYSGFEERWLIPGWLPQETIAMMVAPPGSFKTWLEFDLAISVVTGSPFMGVEPLRRGPVLIFQQEDPPFSTVQRIEVIYSSKTQNLKSVDADGVHEWRAPAWEGLDGLKVLKTGVIQFHEEELMTQLERVIEEIKPVLIIIDPLYMSARQDNYMADAVQDMKRLKDWRTKYKLAILIAHHTKKGADKGREGLLGSQYLNAFLETSWHIRKLDEVSKPNNVTITRTFKNAGVKEEQNLHFRISTEEENYFYKVRAFGTHLPSEYDQLEGKILELMSTLDEPAPPEFFAGEILEDVTVLSTCLENMKREGLVLVDEKGQYYLTHLPPTSVDGEQDS